MVRTSKQSKTDPESWGDPFWTYVLGEEDGAKKKRSWGIRRRSKEKPSDSTLLGHVSDDRNVNSSSRQDASSKRGGLLGRRAEQDSSPFFFDSTTLTNEESAWSFLDQPYEISEKDWKKQQKKELAKESKLQKQEKKAQKTAEQDKKITTSSRRADNDEDSWLGVFSSTEPATKTNRFRIRSVPSGDSRSIVSSGSFYDQPYEISEREWKWQKIREKRQEKRNKRKERKALKAAAKETKIKLNRRKKKGNDDDSWLALFSSVDDGDAKRGRRSIRSKSKQSGDAGSVISVGSWFQNDEKAGQPKSIKTESKSKSKGASDDISVKVWDGLTATFEPWLDAGSDDDCSSATSYSDVSTETEESTSLEDESRIGDDDDDDDADDVSTINRAAGDVRGVEQAYTSPSKAVRPHLRPILKSHRVDELSEKFSPAIAGGNVRAYDKTATPVKRVSTGAHTATRTERSIPDALPRSSVPSEDDIIPDRWRTTVTAVGDDSDAPRKWQPEVLPPEDTKSGPEMRPFSLALNPTPRAVCCSIKNLSPEQLKLARETGLPVHELSQGELATIFPKLRSVANDNKYARPQSLVIGNSLSFERDLPAHVQAVLNDEGPQSLYEYDYESAVQKTLLYEAFGNKPRELLKIHETDGPPAMLELGLLDDSRVLVQVEVRR